MAHTAHSVMEMSGSLSVQIWCEGRSQDEANCLQGVVFYPLARDADGGASAERCAVCCAVVQLIDMTRHKMWHTRVGG